MIKMFKKLSFKCIKLKKLVLLAKGGNVERNPLNVLDQLLPFVI